MFQLKKWYLDCTLPDGGVAIVYWARARLGGLTVRYASYLLAQGSEAQVRTAFTLRCGPEPEVVGGVVNWACPGLEMDGRWEALCGGIERTLLQTDQGDVRWSCIIPRARCTFTLGKDHHEGLGYVERLEMTIPPWQLPLRELRWGRWLAESRSLVWLDWRGAHPLTLIAEDGREVVGSVDDARINLADGRELHLARPGTLRRGELGATVLGKIPGLSRMLPAAMMRTSEHKSSSHRCELAEIDSTGARSKAVIRGDAVYELVTFGA